MTVIPINKVPEHDGLGFAERGNQTLLGDIGHWHRWTDRGAERRHWVRGTVEACETDLSDEDLLAKIREADEAIDPMPQFERFADANAIRFLDEAPEIPHHRPPNAPTRFISTKPQRGGKRTCMNLVGADCGHSESRHNANGSCRTCGCTEFMVKDES